MVGVSFVPGQWNQTGQSQNETGASVCVTWYSVTDEGGISYLSAAARISLHNSGSPVFVLAEQGSMRST